MSNLNNKLAVFNHFPPKPAAGAEMLSSQPTDQFHGAESFMGSSTNQ